MGTTHFDGLEVSGVPTMGVNPLPLTTVGTYFFVSSTTGSNSFAGTSAEYPFATLAYALSSDGGGLMVANRGDTIVVAQGHAETLAAAGDITVDIAGVNIIGLGSGADRPEFTFGTATTASIAITAANVTIKNVVGIAALDALTKPFHVTGANCTLDIEWQDASSTVEAATVILTSTAADGLRANLKYIGFPAGNAAVSAIQLVGVNNAVINLDCYGIWSTSVVDMLTTQCTNVEVYGYVYNSGTDGSKDVTDTIGTSTWFASLYDGAIGSAIIGGSATSGQLNPPSGGAASEGLSNYLAVTATLTSATWNSTSANGHEVFVVTGPVRVRIIPRCTTNCAAAASGVISLGTSSNHASMIANTSVLAIDSGEAWLDTTPTPTENFSAVLDKIVIAEDIGYDISTSPATSGVIVFHCWWEPLIPGVTGTVTAGAGGSMA